MDLMDSAIKSMVSSIGDKYSIYLNKGEYDVVKKDDINKFNGIGVKFTKYGGELCITDVIADSPANKSGIQKGDIVKEINGDDPYSYINDNVLDIGNKVGEKINLNIYRSGKSEIITTEVSGIRTNPVKYSMLNDIGYIYLEEFDSDSYNEFKKALNNIKKEKPKGLIIDIRDNGGGYLSSCISIIGEIAGENLVTTIEGKGVGTEELYSEGKGIEIPLVLLVNENSASASELFASNIKDYKIGKIVGKTTYGKGLVQEVFKGEDGYIKLTIGRYYTPNGDYIDGKGVEPDVYVDQKGEKYFMSSIIENDNQLQKAIDILN
jgi:carboxyl-terminal processing protease